jgi:hypothetical protein
MFKNIIRKADIILAIALIIVGSISSFAISQSNVTGNQVTVQVNGKTYGTYSLSNDQDIEITQGKKTNTVHIKDGKVSMSEASCHNQVCVKHKSINTTGESIICLPNKVIIKIQGTGGDGYDAISS